MTSSRAATFYIQAAIDAYHESLTPQIAADADGLMRHLLKERGLYFGDRPLCTVIRPHFYTTDKWQFLQTQLNTLLSAFQHVHNVCINNADYRARLRLDPHEETLFAIDQQRAQPLTSSRLDTFFVADTNVLKCVEYNAETPAGIGYNDILSDVFLELEPMKQFQQRFHTRPMKVLYPLHESIIRAYRAFGGREQPQIGILDWQEVPTLNEHEITRQYFEQYGYKTQLADPRNLEFRDGHLWSGDFRIDIVYKRVLYSELLERMGLKNPIIDAVRAGAVFITNSPACKLLAKKASLAFLSDERHRQLFSPAQQQAIDAHIPFTRLVEDRKTMYMGREIDLLDFINQNRQILVLKPNDDYGGHGVVLGWDASDEEWAATLKTAQELPYVVQQKVDLVERPFPSMIDDRLDISLRYVDADPFVFDGTDVLGCLTRLSSKSLLNVTAGGGSVVPIFVLSEKS